MTVWRWVTGAGGLACVLAGALVLRFGGGWPVMGSRYDTVPVPDLQGASRPAAPTEADLWRSIDSGDDPTQNP